MSRSDGPKRVISVAGVVGSDPEVKTTDYGDVAEFRVAVTTSYEEGSESKWFDVSVWNEGLIESVESEIFRGAKVAVEGTYSVRESGGREYPKISAARVGLIDWLQRSKGQGAQKTKAAASSTRRRASNDDDESDDEEEEKPQRARRAPAARSTGRTSSRKAVEDDTEDDDLPW